MERAHYTFRVLKTALQVSKKFCSRHAGLFLGLQGVKLLLGKLVPFQIRDQPVRAAGNVPHVKSNRAETVRCRPNLMDCKSFGVRREILSRLAKRIEDGRKKRIDLCQGTAKPGFGKCGHDCPGRVDSPPGPRSYLTEICVVLDAFPPMVSTKLRSPEATLGTTTSA